MRLLRLLLVLITEIFASWTLSYHFALAVRLMHHLPDHEICPCFSRCEVVAGRLMPAGDPQPCYARSGESISLRFPYAIMNKNRTCGIMPR
jgi:hypothetical protein